MPDSHVRDSHSTTLAPRACDSWWLELEARGGRPAQRLGLLSPLQAICRSAGMPWPGGRVPISTPATVTWLLCEVIALEIPWGSAGALCVAPFPGCVQPQPAHQHLQIASTRCCGPPSPVDSHGPAEMHLLASCSTCSPEAACGATCTPAPDLIPRGSLRGTPASEGDSSPMQAHGVSPPHTSHKQPGLPPRETQ